MTTISFSQSHQTSGGNNHRNHHLHRHIAVVEEINGLIKVYNDGCVERPLIVPTVSSFTNPSAKVTAFDTKLPNEIPTRVYLPTNDVSTRVYKTTLPLVIYFHGGGFCVGSAAWSCYHDFLTNLAGKSRCVVVSVNYRLAPEHRLPAAYEDGVNIVNWLINQKNQTGNSNWLSNCDLQTVFLAGDSAGANIAYQVAVRINNSGNFVNKLNLKGIILIHPFFGGESRTSSEKQSHHSDSSSSALTLSASDTYWRLALPRGANRDHPWCNPLISEKLPATIVFVAENDILRDRNLEMVKDLMKMKTKVRIEGVVHGGVGHCFHVLDKSQMSRDRIQDLMFRLRDFINH